MFFIFALLKFVLVASMLASGAFFLASGLGIEISIIKYKGLEAHGVPVGLLLIAAGIALAFLWKIRREETTVDTYTDNSPDGNSSTMKRETKTRPLLRIQMSSRFMPKLSPVPTTPR